MKVAESTKSVGEIRLDLPGGSHLIVDCTADESQTDRAQLILRTGKSDDRPFLYPPRYEPTDPRGDRQRWAEARIAASFQPQLPSLLVPEGRISVRFGVRGDHLPGLITKLAGTVNVGYFPRRIRTTRGLTNHLYAMLKSGSEGVLLGPALQDFVRDADTDLALVELDEFRYRLEYVFSVLNQRDVAAIVALNPPVGDSTDEKRRLRAAQSCAQPYIEVLADVARKASATVVDLMQAYDGTHLGEDWLDRATDLLSTATAERLRAARRGHTRQRRRALSRPLRRRVARITSRAPTNDRYELPTSGTFHFSDGTTARLEGREVAPIYLQFPADDLRFARRGPPPWNPATVRPLKLLGGRNEFERTRQRQIVDWLASMDKKGRPRILLIGDSIRMRTRDSSGYGLHAYRELIRMANITHIPHNCGGSGDVLDSIDDWLECRPDIVHINAGLHDLVFSLGWKGHIPSYNTIEDYAGNLEELVRRVNASSAKTIIWASSTPVHEEWHATSTRSGRERSVGRLNSDIRAYNVAAEEVMRRHQIPVNDLFSLVWDAGVERMLLRDGVHLTFRAGVLLGNAVAECVLRYV